MKKVLYLLDEEVRQEDYPCKAQYLYKSEFNHWANVYLQDKDYLYLSMSSGVINPSDVISPYEIKVLSSNSLMVWSVCVFSIIKRYLEDKGIESICFLTSGNTYNKLIDLLIKTGIEVEYPIKNYTKVEIKVKWVRNKIVEGINSKLRAL